MEKRACYYPVYLDLRDRLCVVVGGDTAARAKVEALLASGARVTVVAPQLTPSLAALAEGAEGGGVRHLPRAYRPGDLEGAFLAISVLSDPAVNQPLWEEAQARGVPVNVMDDVPRCSFIAPSVVRRGDLALAISTAGKAPALAVRLREALSRALGEELARFLELAGELRAPLAARHAGFEERRSLWYRVVDSDVLELLRRGEDEAAVGRIEEITGIRLSSRPSRPRGASERAPSRSGAAVAPAERIGGAA